MRTEEEIRWCTTCRADVTVERPECLDEHDGDCPEWVCVRCAEAFVVAGWSTSRRSA